MAEATDTLLVEIKASLAGFTSQMKHASGVVEENTAKMNTAIETVRSAVAGLGGAIGLYLGADAVKHIADTNISFQRMYFTMEAATGSAEKAGQMMAFLEQNSQKLGTNLKEGGQQFAMLLSSAKGNDVTVPEIQNLYLGLSKTFDIFHTSVYRQQRVLYAFNEMLSMGTVRTRQFQRMLSVDLPGVPWAAIAAKQLGMTNEEFEKNLKSGNLLAKDVIPALARGLNETWDHSKALNDAVNGLNANLNRMHNAFYLLEVSLSKTLLPLLTTVASSLTGVAHAFTTTDTQASDATQQFEGMRAVIFDLGKGIAYIEYGFKNLGAVIAAFVTIAVQEFQQLVSAWAGLIKFVRDARNPENWFSSSGRAKIASDAQAVGQSFKEMGTAVKTVWDGMSQTIADNTSALLVQLGKLNHAASSTTISPPGTVAGGSTPPSGGGSGPKMTDGIKSYAMEAIQTQLMAAKAGSMERLGIAREEVKEAALLYGEQSKQYQEALRRMNAAYKAYEKDKAETARKAQQEQLKHYEKLYQQTYQRYMQLFGVVTQAVDQSVKGMIRGTITAHQAVRNIFQSILGEFIDMCIKQLTQWIATQIAMTSVQEASTAQRQAIEDAANKQTLLKTAAVAAKKILMKMWEVMASVYSAIAGIPYVGPFLAPAMAIAAGALVASWAGRVASAAGGWANVPEDQMAMIHKNEMVLPATLAERVRSMTGAGGAAAGGRTELHIHAVDADSFRRLLLNSPDALAEAIRRAHRNGAFA